MVVVMESPTTLLYHTFCLRCDKRDFNANEVNENIVIDYVAGDVICGKCGEVLLEHLIHYGNEVVVHQDDYESGKVRESRSSGKSDSFGSSTTIFMQGPENLRQVVERAQRSIVTKREKVILANMHVVAELCAKMNLTTAIKEKAIDIFTSVLTSSATISKVDLIAAVSVYLACRVEGYPRLLDEVGQYSAVDPKEIRKIQGPVARKLSLAIGVIRPCDICNRMAVHLSFTFHQRQLVYDLCQEIARYELFDTSPPQLVVAGLLAWVAVLSAAMTVKEGREDEVLKNSDILPTLSIHDLCRVCFVPIGAVNKIFLELHEYLPIIAPAGEFSTLIQSIHSKLLPRLEKYLEAKGQDVVIVPYSALPSERSKDGSMTKSSHKRKFEEAN